MQVDALHTIENFVPDSDVGAVVVGFDDFFSYPKLVKAATYLKNPNVHFIGTNPDIKRPSPNGNAFPGIIKHRMQKIRRFKMFITF